MVEVRQATADDAEGIIDLIHNFNAEYFDVPLSDPKTRKMVDWVIDEGVMFVSGTGFIAGMVVDDLFRDWTVLQEFGWYAEDKSGIALLDAFIQAGRDLQVDEVRVCTLSTSSAIAGRILRRKGFAPLEESYRLKIGA